MKHQRTVLVGALGLACAAAILPLGGCSGYQDTWLVPEDTVSLYSLARPELLDRPAAYDFISYSTVVVEATDRSDPRGFDMAVSELDGQYVALPAGMFQSFDISPGIAVDSSGATWDDLVMAPKGGYVTDAAVPLRTDVLYAIKTRRDRAGCNHYGKFQVLSVASTGEVELRVAANTFCNRRDLVPSNSN